MASILDDLIGVKGVAKDGVALVRRALLNFEGAGITVTDDPNTGSTKISISVASGTSVEIKKACRCATTANVTLSGLGTHDGVAVNAGDRVFVRAQTTQSQNGPYIASAVGWLRADDFDASSEIGAGTIIPVDQGTLYGDSLWMLTTNAPIVLGTSALTFKRLDTNDASSIRSVLVSAAAPAAGDALLYTSPTAAAPGKVSNANIAANAAIALSKLASGSNGQIVKMVAGVPTWGTLTTSDFGTSEIIQTPAGTVDNWSPTGWAGATHVRMAPASTPPVLNGFAAVASGAMVKTLTNDGSVPVYIRHAAPGQGAGNTARHATGFTYFVLWPGASCEIYYSAAAACWYVAGVDARSKYGSLLLGNSGEVEYVGADGVTKERRARTLDLDIETFRENGGWSFDSLTDTWVITVGNTAHHLRKRLNVPFGAQLTQVRALIQQDAVPTTGTALSVRTITRDKTAPYTASAIASLGVAAAPLSAGFHLLTLALSYEANVAGVTLQARIASSSGGGGVVVHWADYSFLDPGPRNHSL